MRHFLIALILVPFFIISLILPYLYIVALRNKIESPHTKNLDNQSFVWLGLILTFLIADVFIIRYYVKKFKTGKELQ